MLPIQLAALLALTCVALFAVTGRLRFLADEFADRRKRGLAGLLLVGILAAVVFYPAVSSQQAATIDPTLLWFPELFLGHALLVAFLLGWWGLRADQPLSRLLHLEPLLAADVWRGLWLGSVGWVATILVTMLVGQLLGTVGALPAEPEIPPLMFWIVDLPVWRKLLVIAVAMTVEESFFRGFLQPRVGWLLSSLLFALSHASYGMPMLVVSVLVISLVLAWNLQRTGRLLPCIVAHGVFDAIQLLVIMPWAVHMLEEQSLDPLMILPPPL